MLKSVVKTVLRVFRYIIAITAIWLIIEYVYYRINGGYILYYKLLVKDSQSFGEYMAIVYDVFSVQHNTLANIFSNYWMPCSALLSLVLASLDTVIFFQSDSKSYLHYIFIDVISLIVIAYMYFLP